MAPPEVERFDRRAFSYDEGWLGEWHRLVAERSALVALSAMSLPTRVLDVGCGTGVLLRALAARLPGSVELIGVDPAPSMLAKARAGNGEDGRVRYEHATAEALPFEPASFDLVVSTLSFDHWSNQRAGLLECARVLRDEGRLVLADLFAAWLWPTGAHAPRPGTDRESGVKIADGRGLPPSYMAARIQPRPACPRSRSSRDAWPWQRPLVAAAVDELDPVAVWLLVNVDLVQ
jgi:SAM-dependent methyltransferase